MSISGRPHADPALIWTLTPALLWDDAEKDGRKFLTLIWAIFDVMW